MFEKNRKKKKPEHKSINLKTFYKISTDVALTASLVANFGPGAINTIGFFGNMVLDSLTGQSFAHPRTYETSHWDSKTTGENVSKECSSNLMYTDYNYAIKEGLADEMRAKRDSGKETPKLDDIILNCMMDEVDLGLKTRLLDKAKTANSLEELDKVYLEYFSGLNAVSPHDHGACSRGTEPNNPTRSSSDPSKKSGVRDNPLDLLSISDKYFGRVSNNLNASSQMAEVWPGFYDSSRDTSFLMYKKFLNKVYDKHFNSNSATNQLIRETYKQKYRDLRQKDLDPNSDQFKKAKELSDKLTSLWKSSPASNSKTSIYLNKLKQQYQVSGTDDEAGRQLIKVFLADYQETIDRIRLTRLETLMNANATKIASDTAFMIRNLEIIQLPKFTNTQTIVELTMYQEIQNFYLKSKN